MPQQTEHRIGLRFDRRDIRALRTLAIRAQLHEIAESHIIFSLAAEAASTGEPLIVVCQTPDEAAKICSRCYIRYGVRQPAIEQVS
jgi:mitochondrial fission protein ELM1